MTVDEIKREYSMRRIVEMYGYNPNRAGFISCPFHKEKTASMKIYADSYYCFGCGCSGDIFSFVKRMDNCDFKTAFYSLGGTYEAPTFESKLSLYRAQKKKEMREHEKKKLEDRKKLNRELIDIYRYFMEHSEPLGRVWTESYNALQKELYKHGELNGIPY